MEISDENRRSCLEEAVKCYGTACIFERRAQVIRNILKINTFVGLAVPLTLGAVSLSLFTEIGIEVYRYFILTGAIICFAQWIFTLWIINSSMPRNLDYYVTSKAHNYRLSTEFLKLARNKSLNSEEYKIKEDLINEENKNRTSLDEYYVLSEKEKYYGNRCAHKRYQLNCVGCGKTPQKTKGPCVGGICGKPPKKGK